jgi:hypothetical protein
VVDLGLQVELLEAEKGRFEDECICLRYELTGVTSKYNALVAKINALLQEAQET